jgi:hypothetical protein
MSYGRRLFPKYFFAVVHVLLYAGVRRCTQADRLLIFGASVAEFDVQQKPADSVRIITSYNLLRGEHLRTVLPPPVAEGSSATNLPTTPESGPRSPKICLKALRSANDAPTAESNRPAVS